ncbi:heat-inducible transcriptional repressor HrcA [Vaginisenegalia massiliensis]|uniref:heat-inducible transcriptional repressor HrcA n=1 Tax=Vaginisenegalia massiliensis TaxID=2058294 RepID=UPI000F52A8EE|nr:heat-inducible transcriptional repressor HrcA [Vaginisenegalia massiliensis]
MLTPRQQQILNLIIQLYGEFEEPIGSKTLLRESYLNVSPATIRNEMMALEKQGFLLKAHSSSGRIPSFNGLRFYVDHLIHHEDELMAGQEDLDAVQELFQDHQYSGLQLAQMAADYLVSITGYTAVVLAQTNEVHHLQEFRLVHLNDYSLVAILLTDSGQVESHLFHLNYSLNKEVTRKLADLLNEELKGLTLEEVAQRMKLTIPLMIQRNIAFQLDFTPIVEKSIHRLKGQRYLVSGKNNLFDFLDPQIGSQGIKQLMSLVDGSPAMYQLLEQERTGLDVTFGIDFDQYSLPNICLLKGSYRRQNQQFTLGLLGPATMPYQRLIAIMEKLVKELSSY